MKEIVITKGSRHVPAPNECITCPYQKMCNGGEKCIEDADKIEARRAKAKQYKQKKRSY